MILMKDLILVLKGDIGCETASFLHGITTYGELPFVLNSNMNGNVGSIVRWMKRDYNYKEVKEISDGLFLPSIEDTIVDLFRNCGDYRLLEDSIDFLEDYKDKDKVIERLKAENLFSLYEEVLEDKEF